MSRVRIDWFVLVTAAVIALSGCGGGCGGCGTLQPIPGGFPVAKRMPNAVQVRLSQTGLAAVSANPAALIGTLAGGMNGVVQFPVPASCGGSTPICCPGGNPQANCGPIDIDLTQHPGDSARLVLAPQQGASTLNVTARMRIKTEMDIPVTVPVAGDCGVHVDTTQGSTPDVQIDVPITFQQDPMTGTTQVVVGTVNLTNLESSDVSLSGGFGCQVANFGLSFFIGTLTSALTSQVQSAIQDQTCKKCPSGDVAECGSPFATACTSGVCEEGSACLQELGLDGRMAASALFGKFSPGTSGALDLYEVAGGYGTTDNNGVALGLLGGMEPGGSDRDRCGPPATEPAAPTIPQSAFFQGNTRPDTGQPFDVAIGVHASQLTQFAFAGYQGGLLCLTVGHQTVSQLSTDTISVLSRSLGNLVDGNAPVAVGLRPQSPPTITLGTNTFDAAGKLMDPLLDIHFQGMEIDFFAAVADQYVRIMTVVADVHLPVGLQVGGMGELTPVLGNPMDAFTNLSVKNSEALTESPTDLAALFPSILGLVLPQLSGGLPAISLPKLGGLSLDVTGITSVDNASFLAIFANLSTATPRPVSTSVQVTSVYAPPKAVLDAPHTWAGARPPAVTLALGGDAPDLEWSYRLDGGAWSGWSRDAHPTITPKTFWLKGVHHVTVRARRVGHPETIDVAPPTVAVPIGVPLTVASSPLPFHGTGNGAGCACDARGDAAGGGLFALFLMLVILPIGGVRRRLARSGSAGRRSVAQRRGGMLAGLRRLGAVTWLVALACLPGCNCGGKASCGGKACMTGEVPHAAGRWTSIAGDDQRVMVATYDPQNGDLVAVDATDPTKLAYTAVDGVPDGMPTYDPGTYRGGITDPGPDVGAWTSIALSNHTARIAYQDRDAHVLKYAYEDGKGWSSFVVDPGMGEDIGQYASLAIDASGNPAIAYLAIGVDDGMGHRNTELRLARATTSDPTSPGDFAQPAVIASAPGTCGGLCGAGEQCVASATAGGPETCVTPTTDCTSACSMTQACSAGACLTVVPKPTVEDIPTGTGLWARLLVLSDGRLAAVYYDRTRLALVIAVENAPGTSQFTETVLDGNAPGLDRGMWPSAVVAADGTVHIAYQDALADEQWYTTWNGSAGTPALVDDGTRMGETRTHNVGAGAAIYLANGAPAIAYQDGLTSDVDLAMQAGTSWSAAGLATGPLLDGFSIAATTGHGAPVLAWGTIDPSQTPVWHLTVQAP